MKEKMEKKLSVLKLIVTSMALGLLIMIVPVNAKAAGAGGSNFSNPTSVSVNDKIQSYASKSGQNLHVWKFNVTSSGRINFIVNGYSGLECTHWGIRSETDKTSNIIDRHNDFDRNMGQIADDFYIDFTQGTYYLWFTANTGAGNFDITMTYTDAKEAFPESYDGQDDNILTARTIEMNRTYNGQISCLDRSDFYKFSLAQSGHVKIELNAYKAECMGICLYNINDRKSDQFFDKWPKYDTSLGKNFFYYDIDLTAGDYCIAVEWCNSHTWTSTGAYALTTTYTAAGESFAETDGGKNNNQQVASPINTNTAYVGQIAANDKEDFYSFNLTCDTRLYVDFTSNAMRNVHLYIYDSTNSKKLSKWVGYDDALGQTKYYDFVDLQAGKYTFAVVMDDYTGSYTFKLINHNHSYVKKNITKATKYSNGKIEYTCECGDIQKTEIIYRPDKVVLKKVDLAYNKKVQKPSVTVKDANGKTIAASNYKIKYPKGLKNVGRYNFQVIFDNAKYDATLDSYYQIVPKATKITKLNGITGGVKVSYNRVKEQVTGYQIQYSLYKKFTSYGTYTVNKAKTTSATVKYMSRRRNYYVRVRAFKNTKSGTMYSAWSPAKKVKTK